MLVVDHLGKNAERDQRGTSVKQQAPFFRINAGETAKDFQNERHLILDKMKDGEDKLAVSFRMKKITVERNQVIIEDDGTKKIESVSRETLAIDWDDKIIPAALIGKSGGSELSDLETLALRKLAQLINKEGGDLPPECGATQGLKGVGISRWFLHLRDRRTFEKGNAEREFKKLQIRLQSRGEIDVCGDWVWIPLS